MSHTSPATTSPIGLDSSKFIAQFADFTNFNPTPAQSWNDQSKNHPYSAVFVMAGSEYRVVEPTLAPITVQLTSDDRKYVTSQLEKLKAAITSKAGISDELKAERAQAIDLLENEINSELTMAGLDVSVQIDHIRNNQQDDHCGLKVRLIWSASLSTWFPTQLNTEFTWATSVVEFPTQLISVFAFPGTGQAAKMTFSAISPLYRDIVLLTGVMAAGMSLWNDVVEKILAYADDGGRLYFPAVACQTLTRLFSSLTPTPPRHPSGTMAAPDLGAIGEIWQARYAQLSVLDRNWFRTDTYDLMLTESYNTPGGEVDNYYRVALPDLAWLPGGAGTIVTFKISVVGSEGFAVVAMLFDNQLQLQMVAGVTQFGDDTLTKGPPTWRNDAGESSDNLVGALIDSYFNVSAMQEAAPNAWGDRDDNRYFYLPEIMTQVMQGYGNHMQAVSANLADTGLPQLPTLTGNPASRYDYGQYPVVAAVSSSRAAEVHYNTDDRLFRNALTLQSPTSNTPVVTQSYDGFYQDGQDASIALLSDNSHVVEVHGGNRNSSKLYYTVGTINATSFSIGDSGTQYDTGRDPCVTAAVYNGTNRVVEVHSNESTITDNLYYITGTWKDSKLSWSAGGTFYDNGTSPAVTYAPDQRTLVVAHAKDSNLKVRIGDVTSATCSWNSASQAVMAGSAPSVAVTTDNRVVLMGVGANGYLAYSLGLLVNSGSSASIRWLVSDVRHGQGSFPCLSRMPDGQLLIAHEGTAATAGQMFGSIDSVVLPPGY